MLLFPPHCSCFSLLTNLPSTITNNPSCVYYAFLFAMMPSNIRMGFQVSEISLFNQEVFNVLRVNTVQNQIRLTMITINKDNNKQRSKDETHKN